MVNGGNYKVYIHFSLCLLVAFLTEGIKPALPFKVSALGEKVNIRVQNADLEAMVTCTKILRENSTQR